jgi:tetratricopeptide (TPR) repeat protein
MIKIIFLLTRRHYYYDRLLQFTLSLSKGTLHRSVRFSAIFAAAFMLTLFSSCNNEDTNSPFSDILSQPAYASLTDSIKQQPQNDELYFRRAVLLNKNNFPEPALADFQKAWSLRKDQQYAVAIAALWMEKKPDSAIIFLNKAVKELPESYSLLNILARSYDDLNKTDEALKVCDLLLKKQPGQANVLLLQSELLEKKGDTLSSITPLEKAYRLLPANLELGFKLAYKYAESKNPKTISFCDSLIKKDSAKLFAEPYYIKGVYYTNINDKTKAIQLFDETIRHNYNYLNAYLEKGKILIDQKKPVEAFKVFQLANTIKPAFPDAYYWMGVCQEGLGQKEDAKLSYEKAYSLDKTFTEAKEAAEKLK